ncbi:MAG: hypothetical protein RIQ89_1760 [Bacteroidota bacterium]|jgi:pyrimidine operon attenuation protein / uracil phosphoribosyltransferase
MRKETEILNAQDIRLRIERIAWQIIEDNTTQEHIYIAGIVKSGYLLAQKIKLVLDEHANFKTTLVKLTIDKEHADGNHTIDTDVASMKQSSVVLVDDVLNSGQTLMHALKILLKAELKKIRTAILVDRNHKRFPVTADFVGISLATTMQEHVTVTLGDSAKVVLA